MNKIKLNNSRFIVSKIDDFQYFNETFSKIDELLFSHQSIRAFDRNCYLLIDKTDFYLGRKITGFATFPEKTVSTVDISELEADEFVYTFKNNALHDAFDEIKKLVALNKIEAAILSFETYDLSNFNLISFDAKSFKWP